MKILHFADSHLGMENFGKLDPETGLNSRLGDFLCSFDFLVQHAKKEKVDLVLFAGDAFKTREPSPTYQKAFAAKIYELASTNIPVVLLVGNHDFPGALGKAHTLEIYPTLKVSNVETIGADEIKIVKTKAGPCQVAGLPWYNKQQLLSKEDLRLPLEKIQQKLSLSLGKKVEYLSSRLNPKIPSILLAHVSVEGASYGSERSVMIGSDIILPLSVLRKSGFDYVALGHIHKHQALFQRPAIVYSGSIERIDFGEEKEAKGFVITEITKKGERLQTKWQFIQTPARKFLTIRVKISQEDNVDEKIFAAIEREDIQGAIVRVVIQIDEEKAAEISENKIRSALEKANFIAGITKEITTSGRIQIKDGFSDELASLDALGILKKFLKMKKVSQGHQEELLKIAERLIEEEK